MLSDRVACVNARGTRGKASELHGTTYAKRRGTVVSPTQERGAVSEEIAEKALIAEGYRIVARNWRGGGGEIDRIAWDEEVLCFVEVRARSVATFGGPAETVDGKKQRKIVRAAAAYLTRFSSASMPAVRFDVVAILGAVPASGPSLASSGSLTIFRNAFDASSWYSR
ncbi:MAG: YraN family protein [Deltaproteobacteria bacterium]|nr:YraN family protein [Deltaproteobacteria bacterium]